MTRGILIAGNESAISRALEAETVNKVEQFAAALIPNRLSGTKLSAADVKARIPLDWNPSSPISAKTLVIAAENRLERIDEAILICSPPSIRSSAAELSFPDVEIVINDHIKGWFFLVRELAALFTARSRGTLAFVFPDPAIPGKDDKPEVLGPSALASFRAFTNGLLAAAHLEPYLTVAFSASDAGNEAAFASFILKKIDEADRRSCGKLFKFGKFDLLKKRFKDY